MRVLASFVLVAALAAPAVADDLTRVGMQLDLGLPGAAGATLVYRPMWWLRVDGGLAYDYVGYGARAGLKLAPKRGFVTPTLGVDAGHFFTGDASELMPTSDPAMQQLLREAVYDFASAHLGLEIGSQRRFSFYLRGGISYVAATANGAALTAALDEQLTDTMLVARVGDAKLRAVLPSASVGFNVFFH
jgi:hypothetical protein